VIAPVTPAITFAPGFSLSGLFVAFIFAFALPPVPLTFPIACPRSLASLSHGFVGAVLSHAELRYFLMQSRQEKLVAHESSKLSPAPACGQLTRNHSARAPL
jgi:hypothetical protein